MSEQKYRAEIDNFKVQFLCRILIYQNNVTPFESQLSNEIKTSNDLVSDAVVKNWWDSWDGYGGYPPNHVTSKENKVFLYGWNEDIGIQGDEVGIASVNDDDLVVFPTVNASCKTSIEAENDIIYSQGRYARVVRQDSSKSKKLILLKDDEHSLDESQNHYRGYWVCIKGDQLKDDDIIQFGGFGAPGVNSSGIPFRTVARWTIIK